MTLRAEDRELVRRRAGYACEFCGVHETDAGGELTIDHFQPRTKGGGDDLENRHWWHIVRANAATSKESSCSDGTRI